ncbi:acid sphingomyelinase-like phosphodiesterase 3b [Stegodyphus dumicola]|uniref:acid sphingomyelinase-like phosphodiesterase 3b n=1 Tax=Stegodyphus dumicola TaxID=202533 RepID=UPI0015AABC4A|nr:acid sphingomyelinase-like phosphodiesterase 3b [Stegodyphus dumicola]
MKGLLPYLVTVLYLWNYILYAMCKDHGIGCFWHITDIHADQNYSRTGNPLNLCHYEYSSYPDNGLYGNFLCDSPQYLVNVTIKSMKDIYPTPDFIIWTGDNLPHTLKFDPDWNVVFEAINNVTELLISAFPDVPVFPSIGNHDTFPPNVLLPNETSYSIYDGYLKKGGWDKFLPKTTWFTFLKGGFYSRLVRPSLRIISLNTILWYTSNNITSGLIDPAYQFEWLEMVLKNSSKFSEKVSICICRFLFLSSFNRKKDFIKKLL